MACSIELRTSTTEELYDQRLVSVGDTYPALVGYLQTESVELASLEAIHLLKFYGNFTPGNLLKLLDDLTGLCNTQCQRLTSELAKQSQRTPTAALTHLKLFANLQNLVSEKALGHLSSQLDLYLASVKKNKCEKCLWADVGMVYCDNGSACSVDVCDADERWHKLCSAHLKSIPTTEFWHCALCSINL